MSLPVLKMLIEQAAALSPIVHFIWHGGEPTLAGLNFYREVINLQRQYAATTFTNAIQTNGTTLTDSWLDFFEQHHFAVGITLDGPAVVHDRQRLFANGRGTFQAVLSAARRVSQRFNRAKILCVITRNSLGHEQDILDLFAEENFLWDMLPYYECSQPTDSSSELTITSQEYAQFMVNLFDCWFERNDPTLRIRFFWQILRAFHGKQPELCRLSDTCAQYMSVDSQGDVYPCDRFCGQPSLRYGNLTETPLSELRAGAAQAHFSTIVESVSPACRACQWWRFCHGDCTYHRYNGNGAFAEQSFYCTANQQIFAHIGARIGAVAAPVGELQTQGEASI